MRKLISGTLENITDLKLLKEGTKKDGKSWKLWGCFLLVDGIKYSLTEFSQGALKNRLEGLTEGQRVRFTAEQEGDYFNLPKGALIEVLENSAPQAPQSSDDRTKFMVRQNALRHADEARNARARAGALMSDDEYFEFAEKCEKWVFR